MTVIMGSYVKTINTVIWSWCCFYRVLFKLNIHHLICKTINYFIFEQLKKLDYCLRYANSVYTINLRVILVLYMIGNMNSFSLIWLFW